MGSLSVELGLWAKRVKEGRNLSPGCSAHYSSDKMARDVGRVATSPLGQGLGWARDSVMLDCVGS